MAVLNNIHDALISQIQGVNGSGVYTHDLSGTGKVGRVRTASPPIGPPYATIVLDEVRSGHDVVLGSYRRDCMYTIVGWGLTGADTDTAREEAAVNMLDDLLRAIESDRTLGGRVYEVIASGRSFVASEVETGAHYPIAVLQVECYLRVTTGV